MKRISILTTIALTALTHAAPAADANSDIAVKDIGNHQYELTLHTSTTVNFLEAQRELAPTAKRDLRRQRSELRPLRL
jgi:hypothetical protein